jgi:hypothetical protein
MYYSEFLGYNIALQQRIYEVVVHWSSTIHKLCTPSRIVHLQLTISNGTYPDHDCSITILEASVMISNSIGSVIHQNSVYVPVRCWTIKKTKDNKLSSFLDNLKAYHEYDGSFMDVVWNTAHFMYGKQTSVYYNMQCVISNLP